MRFLCVSTILIAILSCKNDQSQSDRMILGELGAKKMLGEALSDTTIHNVVNKNELLIKDKSIAVSTVEPLLFEVYGKENITTQRPYEIYLLDNYWVISGTLPKNYFGGTFSIIIDGTNSKIIRLTHEK